MGAPVELATGQQGQVCNRRLVEHRKRRPAEVLAIAPGIWSVVGVTGVNHHVIDAPAGLIVFDTGWNDTVGREVGRLLRAATSRPIAAIVYTHSHFCFGTAGLLGTQGPTTVAIHAHADCHAHVGRTTSHEEPGLFYWRQAQFGIPLPPEGPDADPIGQASGLVGPRSYRPPTHTWGVNGQRGHIAGEEVQVFTEYPFDSTDTLIVHFPSRRLVVHGHLSRNFPSIASNGGGRFRDPQPWLDGLDLMTRLVPEHLLGVHGPHASGSEQVRRVLQDQRDALQFVYDQCVRGINRGLTPADVLDELELPEELEDSPELHQDYVEWSYHVKAIYAGLMNAYWGEATELLHIPQRFESERMVEGFGGPAKMLTVIERELEAEHFAWAAKLARHTVRACPDSCEARQLLARALRAMGQRAEALTTRNICLTQAREWEGDHGRRRNDPGIDPALAMLAPMGTWVRALGFRLIPCREPVPAVSLLVRFLEENAACGLTLRRSVAAYHGPDDLPVNPNFSVALAHGDWIRWFLGRVSWEELMAEGRLQTRQSVSDWQGLWRRFDPWPPYRTGAIAAKPL